MKFFLVISIILIHYLKLNETTYCYEYSPRCYCPFNNTLICDNFMKLSDLNFDRVLNLKIQHIHIMPLAPIIFDSYIYFNFFNFDDNLEITLSNFRGFELLINPFDGLVDPTKTMSLYLNNSELIFYYSNQIVDGRMCNANYFSQNFKPLLSSFNKIVLNSNIFYPKRFCPLLFQNSAISQLTIYSITDSNRFNFVHSIDLYDTIPFEIERLDIYNARFSLNSMLLNNYVFRYLKTLNIYNSSLISFESGLFKSFVYLSNVQFDVYNFYQFIKRFRLEQTNWLNDLNQDLVNVNLLDTRDNIVGAYRNKQVEIILSDPTLEYTYPDSDFCLWQKFPFNRMIYLAIKSQANLTCSCKYFF
jgi:hypothetical protein